MEVGTPRLALYQGIGFSRATTHRQPRALDGMRRPVSRRDAICSREERTRSAKETSHEKEYHRTPKKNRQSRSQLSGNLTVGIDLGDRSSRYCI